MEIIPASVIEVPKPNRPLLYVPIGWNDVDKYWSSANPAETREEAIEHYHGLEGIDPDYLGILPASGVVDPITQLCKLGWKPKFIDWAEGMFVCEVRMWEDDEESQYEGSGPSVYEAALDCLNKLCGKRNDN